MSTIKYISIKEEIKYSSFNRFKKDFKERGKGHYGLYVDTKGGNIGVAINIIHLMQTNNIPAISKAGDVIASCGLYIYLQGSFRVCKAETKFLIHRHKDQNNVIQQELTTEEIEMFQMVARITKQPYEAILNLANANNGEGTEFYGKEAVDMGFANNIVRY